MKNCIIFSLFILCNSFAIQEELSKDDGSFEGAETSTETEGVGQSFNMPSSYSLLFAKIYLSTPASLLSVYVYKFNDPIDFFGIATLSNPVVGWNLVSLSSIQLPTTLPTVILLSARNSGDIGVDFTPPNNYHYRVEYSGYTLFILENWNVGIRLIINYSPPAVEPTSLGSIKAAFH